jgi:hydroxymethylglutaryl-CoA reductase (NADPH)
MPMNTAAHIPLRWIGPIKIRGSEVTDEVFVPLATYETPLWPSTERGAAVCSKAGGISVTIIDDRMTRSVLVEAQNAQEAAKVGFLLETKREEIKKIAEGTSAYVRFLDMHQQIAGNLLFIRFEMQTGDAAGHNMVTKASDAIVHWICSHFAVSYVSISGNFCTDKKVSAVNGILGRGKSVVADIVIPEKLVVAYLKTTPEKIVALNIKKNLIGSILAGGVRSANAHFANILLALYLATGQDSANIVEGSQGIVHAQMKERDLYFSVSLPNIIVGTVGNGKQLDFVQENLQKMGCLGLRSGAGSRRLACIAAATTLAGELSLLAAQTNPGELISSHLAIEREQHVEK